MHRNEYNLSPSTPQPTTLDIAEIRPARRPRDAYIDQKKNGFLEQPDPIDLDAPLSIADSQRLAQYILTKKARPIPTLQGMKDALRRSDVAHVKQQIADLQEQHTRDLISLYEFHAQEYDEEILDRYLCRDLSLPSAGPPSSDHSPYEELNALYDALRNERLLSLKFEDDLARLRHAHLLLLNPLRQELHQLLEKEKRERRIRDSQFPKTVAEYDAIQDKDIQLRIANFLMADKDKQNVIMNQFGWAFLQVDPLRKAYQENTLFQVLIQQKTAAITEVRDPRKSRPT